MQGYCSFCGEKIEYSDRIGRGETCPACRKDLHSCVQCEFYDEGSYNECREPQAERVLDKEKSNFCDYFRFSSRQPGDDEKKQTISRLDQLFRKKT